MEKGSELHGKVALVTGAGKGMGRQVACMLAGQGAAVAINDITPINLDETATAIRALGIPAHSHVADISKKMPVQALIWDVVSGLGRLDILVNCAEVEPPREVLGMDDWDWQRTLDVNLTGAFLLTQTAGRVMAEQGGGIILHAAERARTTENRAAYFASKAGLAAFVEHARRELEPQHIQLDIITPSAGGDILERILSYCRGG